MPETVTLSFRVPAKKAKALARMAKAQRATKSRLLEDALDEAIAYDAWFRAKVTRGMADVAAGRTIPDEEVTAWLQSWGQEQELPRPVFKASTKRRRAA